MKTNFKYFSLAIAALLMVGFASCSSDDDPTKGVEESATKSVVLRLSNGPTTYAEDAPRAGSQVVFAHGNLYFVTTAGSIMKHYTITTDATTPTNINLAELTNADGKVITGLPGNVTHAYIVGNYQDGKGTTTVKTLPTAGPISAVKNHMLKVENQGNFDLVNLYGEGLLVKSATDPADMNWKVTINLVPTVARIQLAELVGTDKLIAYDVMGIFMDNYYADASVIGKVANLVDRSGPFTGDMFSTNSTYYPTVLKGPIYDWYATGVAPDETGLSATGAQGSVTAKPSTGHIWGYNLFAESGVSVVPRILIRLDNVKATLASGVTFDAPQYLTVKGLKNSDDVEITKLEPGSIYTITSLPFHGINLTTAPNMAPIDVTVTITRFTWVPVPVTPIL